MVKKSEEMALYGTVSGMPSPYNVRGYRTVRMKVVEYAPEANGRPLRVHSVRTHGSIEQQTERLVKDGKLIDGTVVYVRGDEIIKPIGPYTPPEKFIRAKEIRPVRRSDLVLW
jgi:hypothetical protein